jgi:hypothetical protein
MPAGKSAGNPQSGEIADNKQPEPRPIGKRDQQGGTASGLVLSLIALLG